MTKLSFRKRKLVRINSKRSWSAGLEFGKEVRQEMWMEPHLVRQKRWLELWVEVDHLGDSRAGEGKKAGHRDGRCS